MICLHWSIWPPKWRCWLVASLMGVVKLTE